MPVNVGNQPHRDNGEVVVRIAPNHCFTHSNRKREVLKREPIDNGWYGQKASRVTLTTWKGAHPTIRVHYAAAR